MALKLIIVKRGRKQEKKSIVHLPPGVCVVYIFFCIVLRKLFTCLYIIMNYGALFFGFFSRFCAPALYALGFGAVVFIAPIFVASIFTVQTAWAQKPVAGAKPSQQGQQAKIWLSLDVVEYQYNAAGNEVGKEKYRSDVELHVVDSAAKRQTSVRSGETLPLQPRRTYFILLPEVPQSYGMTTRLAGPQTQVLRTPAYISGEDLMFERKFVLNSRPNAGGSKPTASLPSAGGARAPYSDYGSSYGSAAFARSSAANPNYYVIQYCSLKNQDDALQQRAFLLRSGIRDARVEVYIDKLGVSYYRLRSGAYIDLNMAKSVVENTLWKNREVLGLKQKPIVVKAGV